MVSKPRYGWSTICFPVACGVLSVHDRGLSEVCAELFVAETVLKYIQLVGGCQFPTYHDERARWVYNQLMRSMRALSREVASVAAIEQIMLWLDAMVPGREAEHLNSLYRLLGLKGVRRPIGCG